MYLRCRKWRHFLRKLPQQKSVQQYPVEKINAIQRVTGIQIYIYATMYFYLF